jgi:hypothetical protein
MTSRILPKEIVNNWICPEKTAMKELSRWMRGLG